MNIIGIDPSLISTALVINGKAFNYCTEANAYNKSGMQKWFKYAEPHITYRVVEYRKFTNYSEGELIKLKDYDKITDTIINDILSVIDQTKPTKIGIEGFSFSSNAGPLIDLVTFSTLLRKKLFDQVSRDITVLAPMTLKVESCKLTYDPIEIITGKKIKKTTYEWRNNEGIAGGKFTKTQMYKAITQNKTIDDYWTKHLREIEDEIMQNKNINKPYEDVNDAFLLYYILRNENKVSI